MSRLGISYCWAILRENAPESLRDAPLTPEMFRGDSKDVFEFIIEHYRSYGQLPKVDTVLDEIDLDDEYIFETPEPSAYYAKKVVERDALNEQRTKVKEIGEAIRARDPNAVHEAAKGVLQVGLDKLQAGTGVVVNLKLNGPERWERYQTLKNAEDGIRGIRSPWAPIDAETGGWKPGDLITTAARLGLGKCVAEGTLVTDPRTGLRVPIEECVGRGLDVLTFDIEDPTVRGTTPSAWINTGRKECLRVSTLLGEEITVTPEHPFLTANGWVRADDLRPGDHVVTVAKVPEPSEPCGLGRGESFIAAVLLSGGSCSSNHASFSTTDPHYLEMVQGAAERLGIAMGFDGGCTYSFADQARTLSRKYGLGSEASHPKRIPGEVFRLPDSQLLQFLRVFWWGVGGADGEITLASEGMADDLKHLLLRFGVVARKDRGPPECCEKRFGAWRLRVESWTSQRLLGIIGDIPGTKGEQIREKIKADPNPDTDNVFVSDKRLLEFGREDGNRRIGRRALKALLAEAGDSLAEHAWLVSEDIVFDQIVATEEVGEKQVYDLTIPGTHAFVAEHLVVHNTWYAIVNAVRAGMDGHRIGFVSPEMSRSSIALRRDATLYRLPYRDLLRGELDFETEEYYRQELEATPDDAIPDWFVAAEGRVKDVADAEMFVRDTHADILIVDGIYLLNAGNDRTPWHERIMMVARGLKELALRCNIPVLATTQFNRSVRTGAMRGGAEAIGGSDAIGQFSDVVVGMFQDENMRTANQMLLRLLKNREGAPVELTVNWDLTLMDFSPLTGGNQEAHANGDNGEQYTDQDILF